MLWQDIVLTVGQFVFSLSLIPTIRAKEKPALSTCVMSAVMLTIYIPTLLSLQMYVSSFATVLVATGWWILLYQSWHNPRD